MFLMVVFFFSGNAAGALSTSLQNPPYGRNYEIAKVKEQRLVIAVETLSRIDSRAQQLINSSFYSIGPQYPDCHGSAELD